MVFSGVQWQVRLVLMQPMNKELGQNIQWVAEHYPAELPRSELKEVLFHSSLTAA